MSLAGSRLLLGCTCCNQTRNVLVSAARASYPTLEQVIWSTMHNQTGAS